MKHVSKLFKEYELKKTIFGFVLTVSGSHLVIGASVYAHTLRASTLIVILGLMLGVVMMITGLFFMETLIRGSALVFAGIQLILFDRLLFLIDGGIPVGASLLMRMSVPVLLLGVIFVIIGFRD